MSFQFEIFWLTHQDFSYNIKKWWKDPLYVGGMKMFSLQAQLKYIKTKLKTWNREVFSNIFEDKQNLEKQMEAIQQLDSRKHLSGLNLYREGTYAKMEWKV